MIDGSLPLDTHPAYWALQQQLAAGLAEGVSAVRYVGRAGGGVVAQVATRTVHNQ